MKLSDLTPDPKNANRGTFRGKCAVERSLINCGAGRSIVVDKNGVILAGNKTASSARSAGLSEDVIVVPTDGSRLVVVQRTDLEADDPKAKELAIADNRTAELGLEWDPEVVKELSTATDLDLKPYFSLDELKEITGELETPEKKDKPMNMNLSYAVIVDCDSEHEQAALLQRFEKENLRCRLLIS
jgi:hypothetical protein